MKNTLGIECRLIIPSNFWRIANNSLLEDATEASNLLGVSKEQAVELRERYAESKRVGGSCLSDVMRRTDIGKARLIEHGKIDPTSYIQEDCLRVLPKLISKGYSIEVFTKGGRDCVTAALRKTSLVKLVDAKQIEVTSVSSDYFEYHDRRTPECYTEWRSRMNQSGKKLSTYVTDKEDEGVACLNAGIPTVFVDRSKEYLGASEHKGLVVIPSLYELMGVLK